MRSKLVLAVCASIGLALAAGAQGFQAPVDPRPAGEGTARSSGMLARAVTESLLTGTARFTPGDVAAMRGDRPCTMREEIDEMLSAPRRWLPQAPNDATAVTLPVLACYSADEPPSPEVIQFLESQLYQLLPQYNAADRWTQTATNGTSVGGVGEPITLLWSLVPDGLSINSNGVGEGTQASTLFAQMDSKFGGNRALWIQRITESFNRWGQLTGINYQRVTFGGNDWDDGAAWGSGGVAGRRGDVRICMKSLDGGNGVLAYNSFPNDGDMVIDSSESWGSSTNSHRFLRNTVMHEHGHGLGFAHTCPSNGTKLMEPSLATGFDGPQQDDIRGGQRNYGDPNEADNTAGTATFFGSFGALGAITLGTLPSPAVTNGSTLSIDANGEQDWHRFTLTRPLLVSATLTPVGSSYLDLDQNNNGSCQTTGTANNALAEANLRLQLLAANGLSTIVTQDVNAAGSNEVISQILMPAGDGYLRVTESDNPTESQLYRISFSTGNTLVLTASNGTFTDKVRLNWSNVPNGTYLIFRNTVNDRATATQITPAALLAGTVTFDDTGAAPGQAYFYWIAATQVQGFTFDFAGPTSGLRAQPANVAPSANAGSDQLINDADGAGSKPVTLNGSASTDPDGTIVNYRWTEGPVVLADGAASSAIVNLTTGPHTVTLTVTDSAGATGTDTVTITVNARPTANAGPDQILIDTDLSGSEPVTLNGSASTDDGQIANYAWTEGALTLASGPSATALVPLGVGPHTLTLTVTDNNGLTATDTVVITVEAGPPVGCPADFNADSVVDPDDLSDYIGCFFATPPCPQADFNADGNADPDDLSDFIAAFFGGC